MLINTLEKTIKNDSFVHLSPQALEALLTLQQIKKKNTSTNSINPKIVKRDFSEHNNLQIQKKNSNEIITKISASPIPIKKELQTNTSLTNSLMKFQLQSNRTDKLESERSHKPNSQTERLISHQQTYGKSDEPTPFFRDTLSSDRNKCNQTSLSEYLAKQQQQQQQQQQIINELDEFKQQVQNDMLIETIITKFDTPQDSMISQKNCQSSQITVKESQEKENIHPSTNLIKKKQMILNQILQLDNQIKLMEDEETKITLNPLKQTQLLSNSNQNSQISLRESLYSRAQKKQKILNQQITFNQRQQSIEEMKECTFIPRTNKSPIEGKFMERLDEWIKRKNKKIQNQQEIKQVEIMKEVQYIMCTFSPLKTVFSKKQINFDSVYQRNQQWQKKISMKKQRMKQQKAQNSLLQLNEKQDSITPVKYINRSMSYQLDLAKILQSNTTLNTTKRIEKSVDEKLNYYNKSQQKIEIVDAKYEYLCNLANKVKLRQ